MPLSLTTFKKSLSSAFQTIEKTQAEALSIEIAANFVAGQTAAETHKSTLPLTSKDPEPEAPEEDDGLTTEEKAEIALLVALYMGYLKGFNERAQAQILAEVTAMDKAGKTQEEIKKYVDDIFEGDENIIIDNVGKKRKEIYVDKQMKLSEVEKVITKTYSTSTKNYAQLIGENAAHGAYEKGKDAYNISQGLNQWVFSGPADERARPWHVALLGEVYEHGSDQSNYAEQCLVEPRCRHRKEPYYGDKRDVPKEQWQKIKDEVGLYWDDNEERWAMKKFQNNPKTPKTTVERDNTKKPKDTVKKEKKVVKEVPKPVKVEPKKEVKPKEEPTKAPKVKPIKEKEAPKKEVKLKPRQKKVELQPKKEVKVKEIPKKELPKKQETKKEQQKTTDKIIKTHENEIRNKDVEKAFVFDKNGKVVLEKEGTENEVKFKVYELNTFKGNILTHNHPNGTPFSVADIKMACETSLVEMRAVSKNGTFVMNLKDGGEFSKVLWNEKVSKEANKHYKKLKPKILEQIRSNEITLDEGTFTLFHETWTKTAQNIPELQYNWIKDGGD